MHPIPVRTMKFDIPNADEFHPLCIAGKSMASYTHLATSLYVAHLEPFFVKALRKVMDQIQDDALREDVDRFSRQEAQHYQRHTEFNSLIYAQGYPGLEQRVDALRRDFERFLTEKSDRFRIGYIEGFESYTTQIALWVLTVGLYDHPRTARSIGDLFKWHMLEEVEHRNVAFDVYQHLYGDYLYRVRMCWVSQRHMFRFVDECAQMMSQFDLARYGEPCRITMRQRLKMANGRFVMSMRAMLPGYSPHKCSLPANIGELSAHYSQIARSIR